MTSFDLYEISVVLKDLKRQATETAEAIERVVKASEHLKKEQGDDKAGISVGAF